MIVNQKLINSSTNYKTIKFLIPLIAISLFSLIVLYLKPNSMDIVQRLKDYREKIANLTILEEEEVKKVLDKETSKIQGTLDENFNHLKNLENQIKLLTESGSEKELLSEKTAQAIFNQSLNKEQTLRNFVKRLEYLKPKRPELINGDKLLEDIMDAKYQPVYNGNSIFFIDSHLHNSTLEGETDRVLSLNQRQACSVEAAALVNPDHDVFLLFARETGFFNSTPLPLIDAILSYKNVFLNRLNIYKLAKNSPVEEFMNSNILFKSSHILTHMSDILRVLTLWKYTGAYYDSDVINLKPISGNGKNFACFQKGKQIDTGIMQFDSGIGKEIAEEYLTRVAKDFNPQAWTGNGPRIFTDVVIGLCNTTDRYLMSRNMCNGFLVLPPKECYEIDYTEKGKLFKEKDVDEVLNRTQVSYAVRFWNGLTNEIKLNKKSKSAYIIFAEKFCPRVFDAIADEF